MAIPRLNGVIRALEHGQVAFAAFTPAEVEAAIALGTSEFDGIIFEMEHGPWDAMALRDCLQYLLNRGSIAKSGSIAPAVTPMVRIPPNGGEMNQWFAKQALDLGVYGIIWPHISTVEQACNAVGACRYPRLKSMPLYEPLGLRGDAPARAVRYWGLTQKEYYARADVWPLDPNGEILVTLMMEDTRGIANLDDILKKVPGIGMVLFGPGDLSQELGVAGQYEHPSVLKLKAYVVETCAKYKVAVGHPNVDSSNVEQFINEGFNFILPQLTRNFAVLEKGRQLAGRTW